MIMTSVLRSGGWEHDRRENNNAVVPKKIVIRSKAAPQPIVILSEAKDLLCARLSNFALRIRNLPQNRRPLCTRGRRNIRWPAMPCLVSKHRKSHRFFRFRWDTEFIGKTKLDSERRKLIPQHGQQRRILCDAARNNRS